MPSRQLQAAPPRTPSVPELHTSASVSNRGSHEIIVLGFATGGGIAALIAVILLLFILYHRLRASKTGSDHLSSIKLRRFPHRVLKAATGSFSSEHKLGQGGFGVVYKGTLRNGQEIAVKKLDTTSLQGEREFQNEVCVIGKVNSPHIVGLLGFCADGKRRLLVYEYMQNRSLQEALFDDDYPVSLDWERRFKIILDTSKALAFLHVKCDPPIIHGDIKPSNVLLDCKFAARIADFGLARLKSEVSGPEVRSEDVEGQCKERERIKSQRRSVEKEKRQRKKDTIGKARKLQALESENAAKDEESRGVVLESISCKDSPSELSTSPNSEDPCGSFSVDQHSPDSHEQEKQLGNVPEVALQSENASMQGSPFQPDVMGDERDGQMEGLEVESKGADASLKSPDSNEQESGDAGKDTESVPQEQRSTDMSREELEGDDKTSQSEGCIDKLSMDSGKGLQFVGVKSTKEKKRGSFGRDWWWRQESSGEFSVKDYVMEWMGHESRREKSKSKDWSWRDDQSCEDVTSQDSRKPAEGWNERRRARSRSSEWWGSVAHHEELQVDDAETKKKEKKKDKSKGRECREWWKEEYCAELSNKSKELKKGGGRDRTRGRSASLEWWRDDGSEEGSIKSKKSGKDSSRRHRSKSREWWKDDELANSKEWKGRRERRREKSLSRDWWSGDLLSRGVSSTPSMRGTICYVAPEYGGGGILSEKSDVYSFGVLLLVIVSGRRPLQVTASPLTEFERANLISWARHLAQSGNVLDLVDAALNGEYCKEQATLCITVALLCLQRLPAVRPTMSEVVKILSGEVEVPSLPFEFSPSPPCGVPFKSRRHTSSSERVAIDFPLLS